MLSIELPCDTWRAGSAIPREEALPSMLDHADRREQQPERHGPDQLTVCLSLTDDLFLRSSNWARWPLEIPPPD